jgi:hypothetical protein
VSWTDATLIPGATLVKAVHITEMRTAVNAIYSALGLPMPAYTDPTLARGATPIKAVHLSELRAAVSALE